MLKKILVNLRNLTQRLQDILAYFDAQAPAAPTVTGRELEFGRFVGHQQFGLSQLRDHLTLSSGVFRHAVRMMLACLAGFVVAKVLLPGHHSYWMLMTITYMLKPAFSLTKQRNVQPGAGHAAGRRILAGFVLWLIPDRLVLLALMVVFMVVSFSFTRINYLVTVTFMTPFMLILFSFMGLGYVQVVQERVLDTVLGCGIAFAVGYVLFPRWESEQLQDYLQAVLRANLRLPAHAPAGAAGLARGRARLQAGPQGRVRQLGQPGRGLPAHDVGAAHQAAPPHRSPRVCGAQPHSVGQRGLHYLGAAGRRNPSGRIGSRVSQLAPGPAAAPPQPQPPRRARTRPARSNPPSPPPNPTPS